MRHENSWTQFCNSKPILNVIPEMQEQIFRGVAAAPQQQVSTLIFLALLLPFMDLIATNITFSVFLIHDSRLK
jgi:hypothetical protein